MISSILTYLAVVVLAEIIQLWLMHNPSLSNLNTYNKTLANIPDAISTGASVLLVYGLGYQSKRRIYLVVLTGIIFTVLAFGLNSIDFLSSTFEYYPGIYWTIPSGFLSGMAAIGIGTIVAGIMSVVLRNMIIIKAGIEA